MKTFLTSVVLTAIFSGAPTMQSGERPLQLEMQINTDIVLQNMVRVFDYKGNLIKELNVENVAKDDISISDYLLLENSNFAFSYLGDYYYLRN